MVALTRAAIPYEPSTRSIEGVFFCPVGDVVAITNGQPNSNKEQAMDTITLDKRLSQPAK